ncbi:Formyltransferase [Rickenella mellea]|uniref:methionyl-tRNA formyltransferase n=1 Tax=Rickenella mellea TaxID=50990 RepID=A0A4Y7QD39_9AGAM|nr:Formyltransferase [Rickenella mellea]
MRASQFQTLRRPKFSARRFLHCIKPYERFKILFFGRDEFSQLVMDALYRAPDVWQSITVVTTPDTSKRKDAKYHKQPLLTQSKGCDLPVHTIPHTGGLKHWEPPALFNLGHVAEPNILLITASFGRFIPDRILHLFPPSRRLNVHPSLLPLYRGPAPIQHALIDNQEETGVCVIEMKEKHLGADVGEIWGQTSLSIPSDSSFLSLRHTLGVKGGDLLVSVLRDMLSGKAIPHPQDDSKSTYAPMITPEAAFVDFTTWDAAKVSRIHRAISHQRPLVAFLPSSKALQLHAIEVCERPDHLLDQPGEVRLDRMGKRLIIKCANDTYVTAMRVKQEGRNMLYVNEWWNGVPPAWKAAGLRLTSSTPS